MPDGIREEQMEDVMVRDATPADAADIARIYNHYVLETTATFDTEHKTAEERTAWLGSHDAAHPVLVAVANGHVDAWGCLTRWSERPAWRHTVEVSVYVDIASRGRGLGGRLMSVLLERAAEAGHHAVIGQIVEGNEASVGLARRFGFDEVGRLREVGRKFDRWLDVVLMEKRTEVAGEEGHGADVR
jgi:phosphinothricin acetyltransferase